MDCANTYSNAYVRFNACDRQLMINSDAVYLVLTKVSSRITGYFRSANTPTRKYKYKDNGATVIECHTLEDIGTLSVEVETKEFFQNAKMSLPIHHILIAIRHPQLLAHIATYNTTTTVFLIII